MAELLQEGQARDLTEQYMATAGRTTSTQAILDSGAIPRLKGYVVKPGKVSDSIHGGTGGFIDKTTGDDIMYSNPPLLDRDGNPVRIMVRTERISTHDIMRGEIPFKDQILATNHAFMRRLAEPYIGTSQHEVQGLADNAVVIAAEDLEQIPFENVLRAYMAKSSTETSLFQHFQRGVRQYAGHTLPDDLFTNGPLPYLMDTPSTKSDEHDETVDPQFLFDQGIVSPTDYAEIRNWSFMLFGVVDYIMSPKGIILVDTKLEHGRNHEGRIVAQDEILTMDSSRWWLKAEYQEQLDRFLRGEIEEITPTSFSKEFARGFSRGEEGYTDEQRAAIAVRYIMGLQHLLGVPFEPDLRPRDERVVTGLETVVAELRLD